MPQNPHVEITRAMFKSELDAGRCDSRNWRLGYAGTDIFTPAGLKKFLDDVEVVISYLQERALVWMTARRPNGP